MDPITIGVALKWLAGATAVVGVGTYAWSVWSGLTNLINKIFKDNISAAIKKFNEPIDRVVAVINKALGFVRPTVKVALWLHNRKNKKVMLGEGTTSYESASYETKQALDEGKTLQLTYK